MHKMEVSLSSDKRTKRTKHLYFLFLKSTTDYRLQSISHCVHLQDAKKVSHEFPVSHEANRIIAFEAMGNILEDLCDREILIHELPLLMTREMVQVHSILWSETANVDLEGSVRNEKIKHLTVHRPHDSKEQVPEVSHQRSRHGFLLFSQDNCKIYFYYGSREIELFSVA